MGQQQLLLVILVTILVGIATVVAINVFGTAAEDANRDAVRQDLLQGATAAQALWTRPAMLDGAGQNFTTVGTNDEILVRLGMPITLNHESCSDVAGSNYGNENGCYSLTAAASELTITGAPSTGGENIIAVVCRDDDRIWQVGIADGEAPTPCGE